MEINIAPNQGIKSSPLDNMIKSTLLIDTINLVGILPYNRKKYEREINNEDEDLKLTFNKETE